MSSPAQCDFHFTGVLIDHADARVQDVNGRPVPVLCFVAQLDTAIGTICRVHQLFPLGHEPQCQARARELRKGMRITMTAPSVGVELVMHNATHVHVLSAATAPARQAAPEAVPA